MRAWTTLNDSEIEKEVRKSIAEVVNGFLQNIVRKNAVLFLNVFANHFFIAQQQVPNKNLFITCHLYHLLRLVETTELK